MVFEKKVKKVGRCIPDASDRVLADLVTYKYLAVKEKLDELHSLMGDCDNFDDPVWEFTDFCFDVVSKYVLEDFLDTKEFGSNLDYYIHECDCGRDPKEVGVNEIFLLDSMEKLIRLIEDGKQI